MGVIEINSGHGEMCIFNPFPALLSNKFVTKTFNFPLLMRLQEHLMSKSTIYMTRAS